MLAGNKYYFAFIGIKKGETIITSTGDKRKNNLHNKKKIIATKI